MLRDVEEPELSLRSIYSGAVEEGDLLEVDIFKRRSKTLV